MTSECKISNNSAKFLMIFITLLATPLTGAGVDIYVPSLPQITRYFGITPHLVQLSLTIYLIGYGLGMLIAGPLADRFGRRKLITTGALIAASTFTFCFGASISLFPDMGGSNSAAAGTIGALGAGIISSLAIVLKTDSDVPLFATFLIFFTITTVLYFLAVRANSRQTKES